MNDLSYNEKEDYGANAVSQHFPNLISTVNDDSDKTIAKSIQMTSLRPLNTSKKSKMWAFFLCFFFGFLGLHRFYVKKRASGFLMLVTLGAAGLWIFFDLFSILSNNFEDSYNKILR